MVTGWSNNYRDLTELVAYNSLMLLDRWWIIRRKENIPEMNLFVVMIIVVNYKSSSLVMK